MSEPSENDLAQPELPRLRIHHLLALTTVFSLVMSVQMGLIRYLRLSDQNAVTQDMSGGISVAVIAASLTVSVHIAIVLFGLAWRRRGLAFPSQPGHWLALFFTFSFLNDWLLMIPMLVQQTGGLSAVLLWLPRISQLVFHGLLIYFWSVAYQREKTRIWKWGWAMMAIRSLFKGFMLTLHLAAMGLEWLLEVLFYRQYSINQWLILPQGPSTGFWLLILANYACLVFFLAAMSSDLRRHRQRHWSHWLVLVFEFVSAGIMAVYYHWALAEYL